MIELNGIYKLKKIRNSEGNDNSDYKILELVDDKYFICEKLNGEDAGTKYLFLKEIFIDP